MIYIKTGYNYVSKFSKMKSIKSTLLSMILVGLALLNSQCKGKSEQQNQINKVETTSQSKPLVSLQKMNFGSLPNGQQVAQYRLSNASGMEVDIITYGGIITSLKVPDNKNISQDIVLGYDNLSEYLKSSPYFGAIIGRYGNRIANGKFILYGQEFKLEQNNGKNHLHGGLIGFDKVNWAAKEVMKDSSVSLVLNYLSKDLEEGYPGNLNTTVTYTLTNENSLTVDYEATTDKTTVVNLTQHSYFNLSGDFSKTVLDQVIWINADKYIPVNSALIPTGEIRDVTDTPFDFRKQKPIGKDIENENDQLKKGLGFDHCWVLNNQNQGVRLAATAYHPLNGRYLEVFTDEPGIQLYTGNFLDGTLPAKGGGNYGYRSGFCLETQHYPDSPNQPDFPSVVLNPGERYNSKTIFKFSIK